MPDAQLPDARVSAGQAPGLLCVTFDSVTHQVGPGEQFTFGRADSCSLCLDPSDLAISRLAGRVEDDGRLWWVVNASSSRSLGVVDEYGLRSVVPPGKRRAVESTIRVLVDGLERTLELILTPPASDETAAATPDDPPVVGEATTVGEQVVVNPADRAALVALFAGYLEEGQRYDPSPKSYAAAAARLGWPRTTLVKRIEYLRLRLSAAGVPNLTGWNALSNLAEYALTTGLITRADLDEMRA